MEKLFRLRQSSGYGRIINKSDGTEVCLLELSTGTAGAQQLYDALAVLMTFTSESPIHPVVSTSSVPSAVQDIPIESVEPVVQQPRQPEVFLSVETVIQSSTSSGTYLNICMYICI
jgi:hypothetical protein